MLDKNIMRILLYNSLKMKISILRFFKIKIILLNNEFY